MLKKNQNYMVNITDTNSLGFGVCKIDGIVVFVAGCAAQDHAEITIIKVCKTYAVGKLKKLIAASPYRINPACPVYSSCGGCVYAHVDYEYEKTCKRNAVSAELKKAGLLDVFVHEVCSPSETAHYRNKAQMPFTPDYRVGYYAAKSHRLVSAPNGCMLLPEIFRQIADTICEFAKSKHISIYDETSGKGLLRHLYLRRGVRTNEIMVCLVINGHSLPFQDELVQLLVEKHPEIKTVVININIKQTNVILGAECRTLYGDGVIYDVLCGNRYEISPLSFYQINHDTAEALYWKALALAKIGEQDILADLYCGIGTISLTAAKLTKAKEIIGIEIVPEAIENARRNAEQNGIQNVRFYCGDANDPRIEGCSIIIVDPPRKGMSAQLIDRISSLQPEKIVYISCAPDTFARDCKKLVQTGYQMGDVFPFDMFPRTGHVETVVLMSKTIK